MRKLLLVAGVVAVGAVQAESMEAQVLPLAVEARAGFSVPTGDWAEGEDIGNGWGFGVNGLFDINPIFAVYAGWERYSFDADDSEFEGASFDVTDDAFRAGLEVGLPLPLPLAPFVSGGLTYGQLKMGVSDETASVEFKSDRAIGYEIGAGVGIPLGLVMTFTPAIRYSSHDAEFEALEDLGEAGVTSVDRFTVDMGLRIRF